MPKPVAIVEGTKAYLAIVSNIGNLLIFPLSEVPTLAKGKGNKLLAVPDKKVLAREEYVKDVIVVHPMQTLLILGDDKNGDKPFALKPADWKNFIGTRAQRGHKLPRGCRHVHQLKVSGP
jgi:topoisomerase-4 subunit A